ncbi:MAG: polymorphic toxin type 50 domain-containing protein [Coriobacteriia bacterium]|nr:polymorphic toxin type 50 domain-containing protein [Coriobacteriia bacterium]MCL2750666.1 polymorphic toxin type 50 domain-containing protein [Coriobacteriia bacterium]
MDFGRIIGGWVNKKTDRIEPTQIGIIHYGRNGAHIVPSNPNPIVGRN